MKSLPKEEWTKEYLQEIADKHSQREAAEILKCHPGSVGRFYDKFGVTTTQRENQHKRKPIEEYLVKGKTLAEISDYYGESFESILSHIPDGFDLFQTKDELNRPIAVIVEKHKTVTLKKPIWTHTWVEDQPYLWVQFPDDMLHSKLKVVGIADAHSGSIVHMREKFIEYINWIRRTDNVFCFINGDLFENSSGESCRGVSVFEQDTRPRDQRTEMVELLAPIAHKILWAIPGNHEDRSRKFDFDPLEYVCAQLKIPYCSEPIFADVLWNGQVFSFYCQHGTGSSQTKGGKMNMAMRPSSWTEFTHFYVSAHVHDENVNHVERMVRDRANRRLITKKQYVVILGSFLEYFGSYAPRAGYTPPSRGTVTCEIYANGDYHSTS